jgi:hypothetical protein
MKKITLNEAKKVGDKLNIDFNVIDIKEWRDGMQIELEHGTHNKKTNVTGNDLMKTGKIALAHILEMKDYYIRLKKMEEQGNKYWANKKRPNILKK